MEIELLYQDDHYLAVNKPSGLLVHPYDQCRDRDHLMKYVKAQTGLYLYPMHRLDRPVSGIVLFALSPIAVSALQQQWGSSSVVKEYLCLVRRHFYQSGTFDMPLSDDAGEKKTAITHYWPLERFKDTSLMRLQIETGRQHQIRRHFSRVCHNLVGDTMYGKGVTNNFFRQNFDLHRLFLHASRLTFIHPFSAKKIEIYSPLPDELASVLSKLSSQWLDAHELRAND